MRQAKKPVIIFAISVAVGIILNFALIGPLKHRGLAFATSISTTLSCVLLLIALRKEIGPMGLRNN